MVSRACCLVLCVLATRCAADDAELTGSEVTYTEERARCEQRSPLRELYFGDLHSHTGRSWDAYGYHVGVTPEQAYRFAHGEVVQLPPLDARGVGTRAVQLERVLDFAAVTDHAEFLGEARLCLTPGSPAYDTPSCTGFRARGEAAVTAWAMDLIAPAGKARLAEICGADGQRCLESARQVWQEARQAAEGAYDRSAACSFVTFTGYEYTATPMVTNMHRTVLFRNAEVIELPVSYYEAPRAPELWEQLEQHCTREVERCDVMVIPHNMNMSNGNMFAPQHETSGTGRSAQELAKLRARMEPLVEVFQHKGDQECLRGLTGLEGAEDPWCNFEKERPPPALDCQDETGSGGMKAMGCLSRWDFLRGILLEGLREHEQLGFNPYQLGVLGSTDTHNGTPGHTEEEGWPGHVGSADDTREERLGPGNITHRGLVNNPGGLVAVWAVERSRDAIFEALRRREVYATSGTRLRVRFFGGWEFPDETCQDPVTLVETGYRRGVPMGGMLPARRGASGGPIFLVHGEQDVDSRAARLERVQIIKGWLAADGTAHYRVFDVAGATGAPPAVPQGDLDEQACRADGRGEQTLCSRWQDPAFDPQQRAFYYARVLEVPTCRWSTRDCLALNAAERPAACTEGKVPALIQERALTSPIWYEPDP